MGRGAGWSLAVPRDAAPVAVLVMPIHLVHHLIRGQKSGRYLIATSCALPVLGIVLKLGNVRRGSAGSPPSAQGRRVG
jgi:hypothetical protein